MWRSSLGRTGFQRMMLFWERWHPVNAVQLIELEGEIDARSLRCAAERLLKQLESAFSGGAWRLGFGGEAPNFGSVVQDDASVFQTDQDLALFVTKLMNQPFSDTELPIRVGVVKLREGTIVWLCYRHASADARSISMLLGHLLKQLSTPQDDLSISLRKSDCPIETILPGMNLRQKLLGRIKRAGLSLLTLQKSARRPLIASGGYRMSFQIHGTLLPLSALLGVAAKTKATVGELLTAALLEWLQKKGGGSRGRPWAANRSVSVLADLTSRMDAEWKHVFGQYICPLTILDHGRPALFAELLGVVGTQLKSRQTIEVGIQNLDAMAINSFHVARISRFLPQWFVQWEQNFLFPIGGAVSNVNLNMMLPEKNHKIPVRRYLRATCATPFAPVIVCLTTHKNACTLTSTNFEASCTRDEKHDLGQHLLDRLFGK